MNESDRRTFLKVAGVGAVAAGAAAVLPSAAAGTEAGSAVAATRPAGASGAIVAFVPDLTRGELVVMVEGREVTVTDHRLVAGLAQAIHGSHAV